MHSSPHSCSMNIKRFLVSPLPSSTLTVPPGTLPSSSPTFRSPWPLKSTGTGLGTSRERSFFGPRDFSWGRFRGFALQQCKSTSSRQAMSSDTRAWCFIFSASVYRMFTMWLWPGYSVTLMHKKWPAPMETVPTSTPKKVFVACTYKYSFWLQMKHWFLPSELYENKLNCQ